MTLDSRSYITQAFIQPDDIIPDEYNPQSLNRYMYVLGNPINRIDPSGHTDSWWCNTASCNAEYAPDANGVIGGQASKKGGSNSNVDNAGNRLGSAACGQPGVYSADCPGYHNYTQTDLICPAAWNCSQADMIDYLSRFAYPGQNPSEPAINTHSYSVDIPDTNEPMGPMGAIEVIVKNGGLESDNIGLSTHIFYTGEVDRTLSQDSSGAWYVTSHGYGNDIQPSRIIGNNTLGQFGDNLVAKINMASGPGIFQAVDSKMLKYIALDYSPISLIGDQPR